jgi:hypothetical protein
MTWYNPLTWFRDTTTDDSQEKPPKPDAYEDSKTREITRFEATIEYRNGDTETFECYGVYSRGGDYIKFNTNPYGRTNFKGKPSHGYNRRAEHYELLAREPELEEVATDRFTLSYRVAWEWKRASNVPRHHQPRKWCESYEDIELTVDRDVGDSDDES